MPLHILVVDDEPEVAAWLKAYLEGLGHRVESAANGIEALTFIAAAARADDRYQLVLLDVHMPLLDGLGVVRELRRAKDYVDVALFTGNHALLPQLDVEGQRNGCLMVMAKPLEPAQLAQLVEFVGMRQGRGGQPRGQTARIERAPAVGYDPFRDQEQAQPAEASDYHPHAAELNPPAESQAAKNARRTQQYFSTDAAAPPPAPAPHGQPSPLPQQRTPRPPGGGTQRQAPQLPQLPQVPSHPAPPPQRPAYPTPRAQLPPLPQSPQTAVPPRTPLPAPPQAPPRDPRYTSRVMPGAYDPRQSQGLPPVPAPVAQPPPGTRRDSRISGLMPPAPPDPQRAADPRRTSRLGAPPVAPPSGVDQRRSSGVMPPAAPANRVDARRSSGVMPPTAPPRATPLEEPDGGSQSYSPHTQAFDGDPGAQTSSRVRRGVSGAAQPPQPAAGAPAAGEQARLVGCAYCRGSFRAGVKPQPYNLVCVHCGQLNRIDP